MNAELLWWCCGAASAVLEMEISAKDVMSERFVALSEEEMLSKAITVFLTVGCVGIIALLAFFLFGNLVTKYKFEEKERMGVAEAQKGKRSLGNVLGNGLSPSLFGICLLYTSPSPRDRG